MAAVTGRQREIVDFLLIRGADPDRTDLEGATALHYAVSVEHEVRELTSRLLEKIRKYNAIDAD